MGVEYYIVNRKNKTAYDLGKGGWYALNDDKECFQDLEYLINYIATECYKSVFDKDIYHYSDEQKADIKNYITNRLAPDLFEFCKDTDPKDIFIFSDCEDTITICRSLGYKFVGHRYDEKGDKNYLDHLDFLNRHFLETNPKHWYDPEKYKHYPEYETFK